MAYTTYAIRSGATITANVSWTDVQGTAAPVTGATTWTSSDESIIKVAVDGSDSTLARITSVGPVGTAQVQVSATTEAGKKLTAQSDVSVISSEATTGTIYMSSTAAIPSGFMAPQPPAPPPLVPPPPVIR